jgi:hypothetical protein
VTRATTPVLSLPMTVIVAHCFMGCGGTRGNERPVAGMWQDNFHPRHGGAVRFIQIPVRSNPLTLRATFFSFLCITVVS